MPRPGPREVSTTIREVEMQGAGEDPPPQGDRGGVQGQHATNGVRVGAPQEDDLVCSGGEILPPPKIPLQHHAIHTLQE